MIDSGGISRAMVDRGFSQCTKADALPIRYLELHGAVLTSHLWKITPRVRWIGTLDEHACRQCLGGVPNFAQLWFTTASARDNT
jgi:hypothetical protein